MDLRGVWWVTPADDDVRRDAVGPQADTSSWAKIEVPGHWRDHPDFADSDGPLMYRRSFTMAPPPEGTRRWVVFDGIFYQADVWLDGAYLGDPEGYFEPHAFDITHLSRFSDEHALAVEVTCAPQRSVRGKRNITGVFQYWDGIDRNWNPGGIWAGVHIDHTGPVRVDRFRVLCRDADRSRAHVLCHARLDSDRSRTVRVRTSVDGRPVAETERALASGSNEVAWSLDIDEPALWWPHSLGGQPLTTISIDVIVDGTASDRVERRTGLREVAWNEWTCSINGERLFLKGANLLPTRAGLASATPDEVRRDVELAARGGFDALRVHGHIGRPELYDAADELGVLLLQDFPLNWGYARSVRSPAVAQARGAVDQLGHHPSIVLWSAHNDPAAVAVGLEGDTPRSRLRYFAAHQLPSWNKSILDRWVKRSFEKADGTRPCVPHSGVLPHLPQLDGTDSHLYFGWYHGEVRDLDELAARVPRLVRFVSEFGAQAVPDSADFIDASAWPDLDWAMLAERHGLQKWVFDDRVPPDSFETFDEWRRATQVYQAELLRHHIETLRRLKYRPAGGFCLFALNDAAPVVSWSLFDHERVPKLAWDVVVRACAPLLVVADRPPDFVSPGERVALDVHVVNDLRQSIAPAVVEAVASWPGGEERWWFGGDVPADDCVKVGRIELEVPDTLGQINFELRLTSGELRANARYRTAVTVRRA